LALDPQSVEARTSLAGALTTRVRENQTDSRAADIERAEGLVAQALALSPRSPYGHLAKGGLLRAEGRFGDAILEYEAVLASDPNSAAALFSIGICEVLTGSVEAAIQPLEQSIRLDPRDPFIHYRYDWLGVAHLLLSHTDEAIVWFDRARSIAPEMPGPHAYLASANGLKGETEHAAAALAEARRLARDDRFSSLARRRATGTAGLPGYWGVPKTRALYEATFFAGLRKAGMPEE
jgi:adenylate cyclase